MNRLNVTVLLSLVMLLCVTLMAGPGCQGAGVAPSPSAAWVRASRATHDTIGEKFRAYVNADPALDVDTRNIYLRALDDWEFMIRQGEQSTNPPPAPTVAPPASPPHASPTNPPIGIVLPLEHAGGQR